jgi:hypothetical protein
VGLDQPRATTKFLRKLALLIVICGAAGFFRIESVDLILQLGGNASDDVLGDDGTRDVVDEKNQKANADQGEDDTTGDGEKRDDCQVVSPANGAQHEQAIKESCDERAKHGLGAPVVHEIAQESRAKLGRSERKGYDGDRENNTRDGNGRARDGGEHVARAFRAASPDPGSVPRPCRIHRVIDVQSERGQANRAKREQGRKEPVARAQLLPKSAEEGLDH